MTDYCRQRIGVEYSQHSDYSRPSINTSHEIELTPDEGFIRRIEVVNGSATSLDIDEFATAEAMVVANLHATDYVTIGYTSSGAATACSFQLAAGDWCRIVDVDPSVAPTFQSGAGTVKIEVVVTGS